MSLRFTSFRLAGIFWLGGICIASAAQNSWSVASPNGKVHMTVVGNGSALAYRVEYGDTDRQTVIANSPLGLTLERQEFATALEFASATAARDVCEEYTLLHGKRRQCSNSGREITLAFENPGGGKLEIDVRAYNDGVAFRYRLPGSDAKPQVLKAELTGFTLPKDAKFWCAPADKASTYGPGYETYYEMGVSNGTAAALGLGWSFPLLFRTGPGPLWALIAEAGLDTNFCGTRLSTAPTNGAYVISLPDPAEGNGTGSVYPESKLPWEMPWRVVVVGDSLGDIVESTLVTDVSPAQTVQNTDWIKPGRVAWSWWSDNPSPKDAEKQKKWIDLAVEMGWEYVLVDANWTIMEAGNVHDVLKYARSKNVGVLLWYNSGGPHNVVTEKPRDTLTYPPVRKFEMEMLKNWGVKGIKVDFFQSDKQNVIDLYLGILHFAAEQNLMINFHGCTLPRGWERRFPHLMTMEAVRGEECYIFDPKYPDAAPAQNTVLPFTRNAVGPMDYTPVTFSKNRYPRKTTAAHELALSVLFESGWVHMADKPEAYLELPAEPKQFLKQVPVTWDETRFLAGYPGEFVVLARRHGDKWYLAGVNATGTARLVPLSVSRLGSMAKTAQVIKDGSDASSFSASEAVIDANGHLGLSLAPFGGFTAVLAH